MQTPLLDLREPNSKGRKEGRGKEMTGGKRRGGEGRRGEGELRIVREGR